MIFAHRLRSWMPTIRAIRVFGTPRRCSSHTRARKFLTEHSAVCLLLLHRCWLGYRLALSLCWLFRAVISRSRYAPAPVLAAALPSSAYRLPYCITISATHWRLNHRLCPAIERSSTSTHRARQDIRGYFTISRNPEQSGCLTWRDRAGGDEPGECFGAVRRSLLAPRIRRR